MFSSVLCSRSRVADERFGSLLCPRGFERVVFGYSFPFLSGGKESVTPMPPRAAVFSKHIRRPLGRLRGTFGSHARVAAVNLNTPRGWARGFLRFSVFGCREDWLVGSWEGRRFTMMGSLLVGRPLFCVLSRLYCVCPSVSLALRLSQHPCLDLCIALYLSNSCVFERANFIISCPIRVPSNVLTCQYRVWFLCLPTC